MLDYPFTFGASLIVKNEESCIRDCLSHIQSLDKIVILDTGSTDSTCEIIRDLRDNHSYPITLIENQYEWQDNFSEARNISLLGCDTDWILCIDADETVPSESIPNMLRAISEVTTANAQVTDGITTDTILCLMENQFNDRFFSDRIIRRDPEVYFKGRIHEYINCKKKARDESIIIRFQSRPKSEERSNKILEMIEQDLREHPDDIRNHYIAAREYFVRGYLPNAIYWFERYLRRRAKIMPPNVAKAELADALFTLGWCYLGMGEAEMSKAALLRCIGVNPDFREAYEQLSKLAEYDNDPLSQERWTEAMSTSQNRELNFKNKGLY